MGRSVVVSGLDPATKPEEIKAFFKACGTIQRVTVVMDKLSGLPKGFAYIEFADTSSVQNALLLNGGVFAERQIQVVKKQIGASKGKGKGKSKGKDMAKGKGKEKAKSKPYGNVVFR